MILDRDFNGPLFEEEWERNDTDSKACQSREPKQGEDKLC